MVAPGPAGAGRGGGQPRPRAGQAGSCQVVRETAPPGSSRSLLHVRQQRPGPVRERVAAGADLAGAGLTGAGPVGRGVAGAGAERRRRRPVEEVVMQRALPTGRTGSTATSPERPSRRPGGPAPFGGRQHFAASSILIFIGQLMPCGVVLPDQVALAWLGFTHSQYWLNIHSFTRSSLREL